MSGRRTHSTGVPRNPTRAPLHEPDFLLPVGLVAQPRPHVIADFDDLSGRMFWPAAVAL
jgi:hypothetical protein